MKEKFYEKGGNKNMKMNINIKRLLIFAIAAFMCMGVASTVDADIVGSEIIANTPDYTPGTSATLQFHFTYFSPDYEYIDGFYLDFPAGVTVTGAQADVGTAPWNGETGDGALTSWGSTTGHSGYGYFYTDQDFTVDVDIDSGFSGDMVIDWFINGDGYGNPPNELYGTVTISEGAADYCYFDDDFTLGFANWDTSANPDISYTSNAGGTSPEARFYWSYVVDGDYIMSNAVDTSAESDLWLSFRSMINHYSAAYPYSCIVEITPDGSTWYDITPWSNPVQSAYAAARYIVNAPQGIGTQTSIRFMITGDTFGINYWYIDDVKICDFITITNAAMLSVIQPDPYATGAWTNLIPVQTMVGNLGNTPKNVDVNVFISHEVGGGTLLFETFDSAWGPQGDNPPPGWDIYDLGGNGIWENNDWYRYTSYSGCPRVYYSPYEDDQNDCIESPAVNCLAESEVHVLIDYMYSYTSLTTPRFYIEGSTDGGVTFPYTVDQWDLNGDGSVYDADYDISSWAAGQSDVRIRFRYESPGTGYRYGYWYFNDFSIYAPTTTVVDYDQTVTVSLAPGEVRTVQLPDWAFPSPDEYDVTATVTLAGDEDTSDNQIVILGMPIGDVDAAIDSIDAPQWSQIGPAEFTPEVTVSQVTAWEDLTVPVTYSVYEQPYTSDTEVKFSEDFEDFLGNVNVVDAQSEIRGIETTVIDDREGLQKAYINWIDGPNFGSPDQWTVIDYNWDDITWNPADTGGNIAMYMGDAGSYPAYSDDWFLSPPINVGSDSHVYVETYLDTEGYPYDYVIVYFSPDGYSFSGWALNAVGGWYSWDLPIPDPSLISADGTVYICFRYVSDSTVQVGDGPYIDNIDIYGSAAIYSETVDVVFDGAETKSVTFSTMSGLEFDTDYVVQASVQHGRDLVPTNDELSFYFDTYVSIYNLRTGKAFGTIQAAIDDVDTIAGDTIIVRDGTYTEDIDIWKDITVKGYNPPTSTTILHGTVTITADGATLQNFKVWPLTTFTDNAAAVMVYASDVTIQDNIICNMNGLADGSAGYFTIKGIHVYGANQSRLENIQILNNVIENIINDNISISGDIDTTLLFEDFEGAFPPGGWSVINNNPMNNAIWRRNDYAGWSSPRTNYCNGLYCADADADKEGSGTSWPEDTVLETPPVNLMGFTSARVDFLAAYNYLSGDWFEVDVFDGSIWHYGVLHWATDHSPYGPAEAVSVDLTPYMSPNTIVAFHYYADSWDYYIEIDDVEIIGTETIAPSAAYGGADGIMIQGYVDGVNIDGNTIQNIHSKGWCYGVEVTPTASTTLGGSFGFGDYFEDFETSDGGWVATASWDPVGDWEWTDSYDYSLYTGGEQPPLAAHSGDGLWGTVVHGDYTNSGGFNYLTQTFDFTGVSGAEMTFYEWVDIFGSFDYGEIFVNGDLVYYVDTYPGDSWDLVTIDLSAYDGLSSVEIQFSLYCTTVVEYAGWYIDDLTLPVGGDDDDDDDDDDDAAPDNVDIICNVFDNIGDETHFDQQAYPGICITIDESTPQAGDGDATEVEVHCNYFGALQYAIINKDLVGILDATDNFYGDPNGPSGGHQDPVTGYIADGWAAEIVDFGPVHFDPWLGIKASIAGPIYAEVGEPVQFTADILGWIFDECCDPYQPHEQYEWDFDDGFYSHMPSPTHVYTSAGTYHVRLMVDTPGFDWWPNLMYAFAYVDVIVTEPDQPLGANADGGNLGGYEGIAGEEIEFYGTGFGGMTPYVYRWDFGDGSTSQTTESQKITHEYKAGEYTVTLIVTDYSGQTATDTAQVTILGTEELYVSIKQVSDVTAGDTVTFSSTVAGGKGPYSYSWSFGDGIVSNEIKPVHTYEYSGTYTVTLTVEDTLGDTKISTRTVTVKEKGETEEVEISNVKGGLSLSATISSTESVDWTIDVQGFVLFGGHADGTSAGTSIVKLPFSIGFGKVEILITAGSASESFTATMFGPFILNVQKA